MEITIRLSVSKQEFNDFIINMITEDIKSKSSESFPENGIYEGFEYRVDKNNDFKQEKVTINKLAENSVLKFTIYYQNDEKFEVSFLFEEINQNEIKVTYSEMRESSDLAKSTFTKLKDLVTRRSKRKNSKKYLRTIEQAIIENRKHTQSS